MQQVVRVPPSAKLRVASCHIDFELDGLGADAASMIPKLDQVDAIIRGLATRPHLIVFPEGADCAPLRARALAWADEFGATIICGTGRLDDKVGGFVIRPDGEMIPFFKRQPSPYDFEDSNARLLRADSAGIELVFRCETVDGGFLPVNVRVLICYDFRFHAMDGASFNDTHMVVVPMHDRKYDEPEERASILAKRNYIRTLLVNKNGGRLPSSAFGPLADPFEARLLTNGVCGVDAGANRIWQTTCEGVTVGAYEVGQPLAAGHDTAYGAGFFYHIEHHAFGSGPLLTATQQRVLDLVAREQLERVTDTPKRSVLLDLSAERSLESAIDVLVAIGCIEVIGHRGFERLTLTRKGLLSSRFAEECDVVMRRLLTYFHARAAKEGGGFKDFSWEQVKGEGVADDQGYPRLLALMQLFDLRGSGSHTTPPQSPKFTFDVPNSIVELLRIHHLHALYEFTERTMPPSQQRPIQTVAAPTTSTDPSDELDRLRRAKAAIAQHQNKVYPKCEKSTLTDQDKYEAERDVVERTWSCTGCGYRHVAVGIPISLWKSSMQDAWEAKAARAKARSKQIRCPTCGNETIQAVGTAVWTIGTSSHIALSCKTKGCDFTPREVTRSILATARASLLYALLLAVVIAGALIGAGVLSQKWTTGHDGADATPSKTVGAIATPAQSATIVLPSSPATGCTGQPTILLTDPGVLFGVAVDGANIYWANQSTNKVMKRALSGGPQVALVANRTQPTDVTRDATYVYFADAIGGTIERVLPDGGGNTTLGNGLGTYGLSAEGNLLFVSNHHGPHGGAVGVMPIGGGRFTPLARGVLPAGAGSTAQAGYFVFGAGEVKAVASDGGASLVAAGQADPYDVASDGDHVFWTTLGGSWIMESVGGGAPIEFAKANKPMGGIAIDGACVYWTHAARTMCSMNIV
jgi:hypothetical protein